MIEVRRAFHWVPYWLHKWVIYASEFSDQKYEAEALTPEYRRIAVYDEAYSIFHLDYQAEEFATMAGDFLKRALEAAAGPASAVLFRDEQLEKEFPALYDYLACAVGPNGKQREGGCLIVYARDGEVTACLKDRGLKRSWYGRSDSLKEALRELEARLQHG